MTHTPTKNNETGIDWEKENAPQSVWDALEGGGIKEVLQAVGDWAYGIALSRSGLITAEKLRSMLVKSPIQDMDWAYNEAIDDVIALIGEQSSSTKACDRCDSGRPEEYARPDGSAFCARCGRETREVKNRETGREFCPICGETGASHSKDPCVDF